MHDTVTGSHWHEPKAGENAGLGNFKRRSHALRPLHG